MEKRNSQLEHGSPMEQTRDLFCTCDSGVACCQLPRSHIHGFDAGLATDTILHHPWQSAYFRIASVIIRSSTCAVHPYRTTEIVISGVIRGI